MAIITSERMAGGGTGSERSPNCKDNDAMIKHMADGLIDPDISSI